MIARFIWGCGKDHNKFHVSKLSAITRPKNLGGWGILELAKFRKALLCKSMWKAVMGDSLWSLAIRAKYMYNRDMSFWIRMEHIGSQTGSTIWRGFKKLEPHFRNNIIWKFQTSTQILIGRDTFTGGARKIHFSPRLLRALRKRGKFYWANAIRQWEGAIPICKSADELQLRGDMKVQWDDVLFALHGHGIFRLADKDLLIWGGMDGSQRVRVKYVYQQLLYAGDEIPGEIFPLSLWKSGCPTKIIIFACLVFYNKNPTWENLQKHNWHRPAICPLCR